MDVPDLPKSDVGQIAGKLTHDQCAHILSLRPNERRMGGWGVDCGAPGLIERTGFTHPVYGAHYRLTPLGAAVRAHLIRAPNP